MGSLFEKAFKGISTHEGFTHEGFTHEGFTDIDNVFQNILTSVTSTPITRPACSQSSGDGSAACAQTSTSATSSTSTTTSTTTSGTPTSFLKKLLEEEKATADSLMDTAKRISPVVQTLAPVAKASDAEFEASAPASLPKPGATLQGFAVLLLVLSYTAFTIVFTIFINHTTQNPYTAGKTFVSLLILGFILYMLIVRLA